MKFNLKSTISRGALALKRRSPEILVFSGIAGMVTGAIMACVATRKLDDILDEHQNRVDQARDESEDKRALTRAYLGTGVEIVKLYGPSVAIEALSVSSILAGNSILRKRNMALAAAYATLDAGFRRYRGRVTERFGDEVDRELRIGGRQETIEAVETDEDGSERKVERAVTVVNGAPSDYARFFCFGEARAAEPNDDYNRIFLHAQQELANHILRANGYLFLNDVYDMLGLERSIAGQSVGWVYDKNAEDHGDNYVDFGIQEVYRNVSDAENDYEKVWLLDFNVDGAILEHMIHKGLITA